MRAEGAATRPWRGDLSGEGAAATRPLNGGGATGVVGGGSEWCDGRARQEWRQRLSDQKISRFRKTLSSFRVIGCELSAALWRLRSPLGHELLLHALLGVLRPA